MMRSLLLLAALLAPGLAGAEGRVTAGDAAQIRAVINRQIEAFRRDDARGAFALVSPEVRQTFGTPEKFLDVVRLAYRAVYRPSAVAFRDVLVMGEEVVQPVQITDVAGSPWLAYYSMQRQRDGSWKTNGCHLVQPARTVSA
jgi:type II secretory pathway pseudopilin PulG